MKEIRDGVQCVFAFGKDAATAQQAAVSDGSLEPTRTYTRLNNPLPTGDHWKVIGWAIEHARKGDIVLARVPMPRRDFIKRASAALNAGFCLELGSMAARQFRDQNDLRMQRGKVYIFINRLPAAKQEAAAIAQD